MAIYITGDTHGDSQHFESEYFPRQKEMSRGDYVVIAGDFGGLWDGSQKDQYWLDWLNKKSFTILSVDRNHKSSDLLDTLPEKEWNGGRVHIVREHVLHLMRGQVFDFGGFAWFTMGGAASHDIQDGILDPVAPDLEYQYWLMRRMRSMSRVKGVGWWEEEMPSLEKHREALANLEQVNWTVDCALTHCTSNGMVQEINPSYGTDELTDLPEMASQRYKFAYWSFGHYYENRIIDQKYILQWEKVSELGFQSQWVREWVTSIPWFFILNGVEDTK